MSMLKRYKLKVEDGFKKLVQSMEQSSEEKQKQILQAMFLEDPIYAQYIPLNIITFDYILKMEPNEIREIWDNLKSPAQNFVFAIVGTADEQHFVDEMLPKELYHLFNDQREMQKTIAGYQRRTARLNIIEKVRELQDNLRLPNFSWKMPDRQVLKGDHIVIPKEGPFELKYDNGVVAMKGDYQDKMRMGVWEHYYSNGKLMAKGIYHMDEKDDLWEFFYSTGKLRAKGRYHENLKEGEWIEHDKYGIEVTINYVKGQEQKY